MGVRVIKIQILLQSESITLVVDITMAVLEYLLRAPLRALFVAVLAILAYVCMRAVSNLFKVRGRERRERVSRRERREGGGNVMTPSSLSNTTVASRADCG